MYGIRYFRVFDYVLISVLVKERKVYYKTTTNRGKR